MQISERFRRGVVVPLDHAAVEAFEADHTTEATRVHFIKIADQAEFEALWKTGLFGEINASTGSMIDDYEEAAISVDMIPRLRVVESYADRRVGGAIAAHFFSALLEASNVAERSTTPVYFVL